MSTEVIPSPQLSLGRLLLLGVSSVILCMSIVMSVFAPFPLALAVTLYGRMKGVLVGLAGLVLSFMLASTIYGYSLLFGFYFCVLVFGLGIGEIVLRGFSPVKSMVSFGLGFIGLIALTFTFTMSAMNTTPKKFILEQIAKSADKIAEQKKLVEMSGDQSALQLLQLFDQPELLAKEMMESLPSNIFMLVFIVLWFNMFMVLKSRRLLFPGLELNYSEKNLINFKMPFSFILILVVGLVLSVWGKDLGSSSFEIVGFSIIKCLGIFYFFQGFGVLSDLLDFIGLGGFFRSLVVMLLIFMANYLIALAGLFDNWFDFRKYFKKQKFED